MAFRFQKRIKIAPGVRLNIGKTGISTTIGKRGASVNIGKGGAHGNLGIPGTGLSTRTKLSGGSRDEPDKPNQEARAASGIGTAFKGLLAISLIGLLLWAVF